jgi:thioredoxin reductase
VKRAAATAVDVAIIGGGPAGLSAALVLGRCGRRVAVVDSNRGRNRRAKGVNGFLTRDGIEPENLRRLGRAEIKRYGVRFIADVAIDVARETGGGFRVSLVRKGKIRSRALLLATGMRDHVPDIPGLRALYGRSVHHCPYCDAHRYTGKVIATLGGGAKAALGLGIALRTWTDQVIVCTNGERLSSQSRVEAATQGIQWREQGIVRLRGRGGRLESIVLDGGERLPCAALFFNTGQYQRSDLPRRLRCTFKEDGGVLTDDRQCTGVPGLYLAGDADRDVQFAIVAAAEGATAAVAINRRLQDEEAEARRSKAARMSASPL